MQSASERGAPARRTPLRRNGFGRRQLVVVVGPTGAGKTALSIEIARDAGTRIVVLDRVQCHRELTVGSGRPEPDGTERVFLADRAVAQGLMTSRAAYTALTRLLADSEAAVLEGGSMSLLAELAGRDEWRTDADVTIEYVRPGVHLERRIRERVHCMLHARRTMVDEVRDLWPDPRTHRVLADVVGYREILAMAGGDHSFTFTGAALDRLCDAVADAHLRYAAAQIDRIETILDGLAPTR